jgi:preprotein translocase subunit SecA
MLKRFVTIFGGDPNKKEIERYATTVAKINALEKDFEALSDEALLAKTAQFRQRLAQGEELDDLLPEAFAAVREASKRTIGLRHYDVQMIGGITLHLGKIAEMRTGEGKTLVATLPLYLNALTGRGVHLVTVNDYLARRDARWMAPVFNALGIRVGVLQMAARTENGKKAFLVDFDRQSPHEDQHQLRMVPRAEAYAADIVYGTNSEFGFDYLRDNMAWRLDERVQRGHYYAIVDEVDNILIDEARTPLIISGPASEDVEWYTKMAQVARALRPEDYEISEREKTVSLTEIGEAHVEELLGIPLRDPDRPEDVTPEQARLLGYLEQALRAQFLFHRNKDYLVQAGKVIIIDEFTGRLMPGRRWSDGLHQAVEAKEGVRVQAENVTYATITIQNYFRMYEKLAGMSGTAVTEAEEFEKIYKLGVLSIPTNLEYHAMQPDSGLEELEAKDEQGYKYRYYARKDDPQKTPVYWKRKDYPDVVYRTQEAKLRAIMQEILYYHVLGRPILVGTTSVEMSERLSNRLRAEPLRRLAQVLLLRRTWFEKNNREEDGRQIPELQFLNTTLEQLDLNQMRKLARELEIPFNPEEPTNLEKLIQILSLGPEDTKRLTSVLQGGITHQVLNARKHTEESQIIAGAGAFGAVTIATNMAGRGVDIKLGGNLKEETISAVNRILRRAGYEDPFDMPLKERQQALLKLGNEAYSIYEAEAQDFLRYMDEMEKVRTLGGLHVIGSERHEARRIDNQLRGRAARQGDPGSSRFYLSMEDELLRLFGGGQADALMQRFKMDDALPLEMNLVSRLIEQSQTRVEGANFDMRKHLLEYDDVLNNQRASIYKQRDRIFMKEDLSEDVTEMLQMEVKRRVPQALAEEEGPWRLLSWLEQIQPPLQIDSTVFPSYTLKLLVEDVWHKHATPVNGYKGVSTQAVREVLLDLARRALEAEDEHVMRAVKNLFEQTRERHEAQLRERLESVETFLDGLGEGEEEEMPRNPRALLEELNNVVRAPIKLSNDELRLLKDAPKEAEHPIKAQLETYLWNQSLTRLTGAITRRVEDEVELKNVLATARDWDELEEKLYQAVDQILSLRRKRLVGLNGDRAESLIARDLEAMLEKADGYLREDGLVGLLLMIAQGARTAFDKKTHRRVQIRTLRLNYIYLAAHLLENRSSEEITQDVLTHLESAQREIQLSLGRLEWQKLADLSLADLSPSTRQGILQAVGDESLQDQIRQPLKMLPDEVQQQIVPELGRQALTVVYRQLLLGVISELWVDYLTQMEALRVSIGLEAYAQRDPLVQYKSRASALFQELVDNMRLGVVTRMFTFRPRESGFIQPAERSPELTAESELQAIEETEPVNV